MFLFSVPEEKLEKKESWIDEGIRNDGFAAGGRASTEALRITTVEQTEKKNKNHGCEGPRVPWATGGSRPRPDQW